MIQTNKGLQPYRVTWNGLEERHLKAIAEFRKEFPKSIDPVFISRENIESFLLEGHLL